MGQLAKSLSQVTVNKLVTADPNMQQIDPREE